MLRPEFRRLRRVLGAHGPAEAPRSLGRAARSDHEVLQGFEIAAGAGIAAVNGP